MKSSIRNLCSIKKSTPFVKRSARREMRSPELCNRKKKNRSVSISSLNAVPSGFKLIGEVYLLVKNMKNLARRERRRERSDKAEMYAYLRPSVL